MGTDNYIKVKIKDDFYMGPIYLDLKKHMTHNIWSTFKYYFRPWTMLGIITYRPIPGNRTELTLTELGIKTQRVRDSITKEWCLHVPIED